MSEIQKPSRITWGGVAFVVSLIISIIFALYLLANKPQPGSVLFNMTEGFVGALISGIGGGLILLFFTLHLGATSERNLSYIKQVVEEDAGEILESWGFEIGSIAA